VEQFRQTQAIVLKETDFGESDKLLTLFSLDAGKLQCIAKGAKRSKKRFVNKLEQFTLLDIAYAANSRTLHRLDQAETIDYFERLRFDYRRFAAATLASEVLLHWIRENDTDPASFHHFAHTLHQLNQGENLSATLIFFFVKLLSLQGYQPILDRCTVCGTPASAAKRYYFIERRFGIVCNLCHRGHPAPDNLLSLGFLRLLHHAQQLEAANLHRLQFNSEARRQAFRLFEKYFGFLLHRDLHSWNLTDEILSVGTFRQPL